VSERSILMMENHAFQTPTRGPV